MAGYVLIVEKDAELQQRIGAALRDAGYELAAETESSWARRSIAVRRPDAVVLGTRLSDGDGFGLAEELRRDPETRGVPIVFIASSHRGTSHRAEARRRFAPAEYLPTPLDARAVPAHLAELAGAALVGDDDTPEPVQVTKESLHDPAQQRERREVERTAKTLVEDPIQAAFAGTLKRTPLARVLQRLYATRASGSLLLLRESVKKIVFFAEGYPFSVRSNLLGECLGQILLEKKLITGEVLSASVARMQKEKRQQGQILIEMGALSPFNLQRALVDQLEAKLLEVFAWTDGKFMFKAGEELPAGGIAPRAAARGPDPRGHSPSLRRGPAGGGAGPLRGAVHRAQRRPGAAPAGDDRRRHRAGVHSRPRRRAPDGEHPREGQDPA